jgi:thiol:disulfide interchange protein DsbD
LLVITEETADGPVTRGFTVDARPAVPTPATGLTLGVAVAFALLGGLILNLMPCVLPVLSIKVLNLVKQAAEPSARTSAARHGLAFAAGILATFLALASLLIVLRAGGASLGWGFQLQEPGIVIALMVLMLALGMNLSGVYSLGGRLAGVGQGLTEGKGLGATFATGVLAVIVASPCTAPFMGAALGFALTRSALETYLVFTALALGFALPLTLLSAWPGWLRLMPVPGPWMERLRNALAFPVYATAAWLLWVLTQQVDSIALGSALAGSLVLAFALWWLGQPMRSSLLRHAATGAMLLTASGLLVVAGRGPSVLTATAASGSDIWSRDRVVSLRAAGTPLLVNFTSAWCITCKVNERVALSTPSVRQALIERGITYLKGDWTRRDAEITRELQRHGRSGVPLYLLYPPGEGPPRVLPQLLTEGLVLEAFEQTL